MDIKNIINYYKNICILFMLVIVSCSKAVDDDAEYVMNENSPIKSVDCKYVGIPLPCEKDNSLVAIESSEEDTSTSLNINFVKINSKGEKETKAFSFNWNIECLYNEENLADEEFSQIKEIALSLVDNTYSLILFGNPQQCKFLKNANDEYYFSIIENYHDVDYNQTRYGIVKFDSQGNVLFSEFNVTIDFTFQEDDKIACTPLDDGGFVVLYQKLFIDDDTESKAFYIKRYDSQGNFIEQNQLEIDNAEASIRDIVCVGKTLYVFYDECLDVFSLDGKVIKQSVISECNYIRSFAYKGNFYISYTDYNCEQYYLMVVDQQGNPVYNYTFESNQTTIMFNATDISSKTFICGCCYYEMRWGPSPIDYNNYSVCNGVVLSEQTDSLVCNKIKPINAIALFSVMEKSDGSFVLYFDGINLKDRWLNKIHVYNTNNLESLYYVSKEDSNDKDNTKTIDLDKDKNYDSNYYDY